MAKISGVIKENLNLNEVNKERHHGRRNEIKVGDNRNDEEISMSLEDIVILDSGTQINDEGINRKIMGLIKRGVVGKILRR